MHGFDSRLQFRVRVQPQPEKGLIVVYGQVTVTAAAVEIAEPLMQEGLPQEALHPRVAVTAGLERR